MCIAYTCVVCGDVYMCVVYVCVVCVYSDVYNIYCAALYVVPVLYLRPKLFCRFMLAHICLYATILVHSYT